MISNFLWLMNLVRTKILEGLTLPELDISYWDFCIILAVVGIVATVLLNGVRIGGSAAIGEQERREAEELRKQNEARKNALYEQRKSEREAERARRQAEIASERANRLTYEYYRERRARNEAYSARYNKEKSGK